MLRRRALLQRAHIAWRVKVSGLRPNKQERQLQQACEQAHGRWSMHGTGKCWLTMTSTWQVRFRLAVQFPKKSSHLGCAGSRAEGLGSVCRHSSSDARMAGRARQHRGPVPGQR